jgi:uncharacterized membrane protein YkvA (DUF1232 family)
VNEPSPASGRKQSAGNLRETAGFVGGLIHQVRLVWRLLRDGRVPSLVKLIPVVGLIYLLSPIDLVPDLMLPGIGEVDDLVILLLALKTFVDLAPQGIVGEHLDDLLGRGRPARPAEGAAGDVIDAQYHVLEPDQE